MTQQPQTKEDYQGRLLQILGEFLRDLNDGCDGQSTSLAILCGAFPIFSKNDPQVIFKKARSDFLKLKPYTIKGKENIEGAKVMVADWKKSPKPKTIYKKLFLGAFEEMIDRIEDLSPQDKQVVWSYLRTIISLYEKLDTFQSS
jgi:hypothetical protein